jgi:hypothetical protein
VLDGVNGEKLKGLSVRVASTAMYSSRYLMELTDTRIANPLRTPDGLVNSQVLAHRANFRSPDSTFLASAVKNVPLSVRHFLKLPNARTIWLS